MQPVFIIHIIAFHKFHYRIFHYFHNLNGEMKNFKITTTLSFKNLDIYSTSTYGDKQPLCYNLMGLLSRGKTRALIFNFLLRLFLIISLRKHLRTYGELKSTLHSSSLRKKLFLQRQKKFIPK
jgi:hypothetical protein